MLELVTIDDARQQLRLDEIDSNGNPITHPTVRLAVLLELASQFRYREGEGENVVPADAGHGYTLSKGATAILAGLRKPTVA